MLYKLIETSNDWTLTILRLAAGIELPDQGSVERTGAEPVVLRRSPRNHKRK